MRSDQHEACAVVKQPSPPRAPSEIELAFAKFSETQADSDFEAALKLVEPLAGQIASEIAGRWCVDFHDLMQVARLALWKLIHKWPPPGWKSASRRILGQYFAGEMHSHAAAFSHPIRFPQHAARAITALSKGNESGRVVREMKSSKTGSQALEMCRVFAAHGERSGGFRGIRALECELDGTAAESPEAGIQADVAAVLASALGELTEQERDCVERRFGLGGYTESQFGEIGQAHGFSRQRAQQIVAESVKKVRALLVERGVKQVNDIL